MKITWNGGFSHIDTQDILVSHHSIPPLVLEEHCGGGKNEICRHCEGQVVQERLGTPRLRLRLVSCQSEVCGLWGLVTHKIIRIDLKRGSRVDLRSFS
jgi:hypothetical protein